METYRLIYDDECPLCKAYTRAFQKNGLLGEKERISFCEAEKLGMLKQIQLQKARHFIPLLDSETGEVRYGLDALGTVLDRKYPALSSVAKSPVTRPLFLLLYQFISYNRRVIPVVQHNPERSYFGPDLHRGYRIAYLFFVLCISVLISFRLGEHLSVIFHTTDAAGWKMIAAVAPGWCLQLLFAALLLKEEKFWEYAGHLFTVMLLGVLALTPYLTLDHYFFLPAICGWISIAVSNLLMSWQHIRRLRATGLPSYFFVSWWIYLGLSFAITLYHF